VKGTVKNAVKGRVKNSVTEKAVGFLDGSDIISIGRIAQRIPVTLSSCVRLAVIASLVFAGACDSSTEPRQTFNLCVHMQGAPFEPGARGAECSQTQQLRPSQTRTVELEGDLYSGTARTADLEILFAPNDWTVSLGGSTISVPGQQTLTMTVPANALPGNYQIAVRASSGSEQVSLTIHVTVVAPV
jgi:hypothetical protein